MNKVKIVRSLQEISKNHSVNSKIKNSFLWANAESQHRNIPVGISSQGVNLASLLNKRRQRWTFHSKQTVDRISEQADERDMCPGEIFTLTHIEKWSFCICVSGQRNHQFTEQIHIKKVRWCAKEIHLHTILRVSAYLWAKEITGCWIQLPLCPCWWQRQQRGQQNLIWGWIQRLIRQRQWIWRLPPLLTLRWGSVVMHCRQWLLPTNHPYEAALMVTKHALAAALPITVVSMVTMRHPST
jgi:hypothetical protein